MSSNEPIDVNDPEADMANEHSRMFYRGEPYTGEAVERWNDGTVLGLWTFVDGFEEGPSKSWYADGSPNHSGLVAKNRPVGEWRNWFPDGRLKGLKMFDGPGNLVSHKTWDETGALIKQYPSVDLETVSDDSSAVSGTVTAGPSIRTGKAGMSELKPVGIYREMYKRGHDHLPSIHEARTDHVLEDRDEILEYLRKAPGVFDVMEAVPNMITGEGWIPGGSSLHSDGEWIWRTDSIEYLAATPLTIPDEFVQHVRTHHYIPPNYDRLDESFRAAYLRYF